MWVAPILCFRYMLHSNPEHSGGRDPSNYYNDYPAKLIMLIYFSFQPLKFSPFRLEPEVGSHYQDPQPRLKI